MTMKTLMIVTVIASVSMTGNFVLTNMLIKSGENIKNAQQSAFNMIDECAKSHNVYPESCQIKAVNMSQKNEANTANNNNFEMLLPPRV